MVWPERFNERLHIIAHGERFDVDAFLRTSTLHPDFVWRREVPLTNGVEFFLGDGRAIGPRDQTDMAIMYLKAHRDELRAIAKLIRYASAEDDVADLVMGAAKGEKIAIAMVVWLIRGGGRNILFDSGYHRDTFLKDFPSTEYIRPDEAVKLAGVLAEEITDIVISHSHWDHLGGIDLFPKATVWIQKEEFRYYTGEAWQPGGNHDGIDPEDVQQLVRLNTGGRLHLVDGDDVEIFPGIRAYTGARHTYASQYLRVDGNPPFVLASDSCYLYRNLSEHKASATFSDADHAANIRNQERMIQLAGGNPDRVIPGHDPLQFQKYPTQGRIAKIK